MKTTFNHNLRKADGSIDLNALGGYQQAIYEVYKYIAKETELNPMKRHIDSVPLIDTIAQTNAELTQLMQEEEERVLKAADAILAEPILITPAEDDLLIQNKLS